MATKIPSELNMENAPDIPSGWDNFIEGYKLKILNSLKKINTDNKDKPIAVIHNYSNKINVYLNKIGLSTQGKFDCIEVKFSCNDVIRIARVYVNIYRDPINKIYVQDVLLQPLIARLSLSVTNSKKDNIQYNASQLLEPVENQFTWRYENSILKWGTKGIPDLHLYVKKWYSNADNTKISFVNNFSGINLSLTNKTFSVDFDGELQPTDSVDLSVDDDTIAQIATAHARALVARAVDWIVFATFVPGLSFAVRDSNDQIMSGNPADLLWLIKSDDYNPNPTRTVDLSPFELKIKAEEKHLFFSWNVYQTICASLNLGRHLILTGPPGCGKSELAALVARLIGEMSGFKDADAEPKVVTASPGWTSGDLIGRYFPYPPSGMLRFQPGIFLQALDENRCLVIDEMNRANLDECFGELFTVLAGHAVDLPYQEKLPDSATETGDDLKLGTVRIVPRKDGSVSPPDRVPYTMSPTFRLIGTMNDADRSMLHQLSFALLRRFDVVRIDPPDQNALNTLLENRIPSANNLQVYRFRAINLLPHQNTNIRTYIINLVTNLFITNQDQIGLIPRYVVGVATMLDVLRFTLEGLRPIDEHNNEVGLLGINDQNNVDKVKFFIKSLATLAQILTVVPQLEALNTEQFRSTLEHLTNCLGNDPYIRLDQQNNQLQLVSENKTVSEFLLDEIKRATRGTQHADIVEEMRHPAPGV